MAEVVLDANVIVALLYADDSQHQRAVELTTRLETETGEARECQARIAHDERNGFAHALDTQHQLALRRSEASRSEKSLSQLAGGPRPTEMDPTENDTLERNVSSARGGNRAALEAVVRAIEPLVSRLALRFFGCPEYARDATQEALVRMVVKLDSFDRQSAFSTWAYRVAINKFLSMARSPAEREAMSFDQFDEDLAQALEPASSADHDAELAMAVAELRIGCTLAMLLCLDRDARLAYILGAIVELDHQVAAYILDCAPATYRKRLERARDSITGLMKKRCGVFDGKNGCHCAGRIPTAKSRGHLNPSHLVFASSVEQVRRFPRVLSHIRELEEMQRAAEIYRSHPDPISRDRFVDELQHLLDAGSLVLDQG